MVKIKDNFLTFVLFPHFNQFSLGFAATAKKYWFGVDESDYSNNLSQLILKDGALLKILIQEGLFVYSGIQHQRKILGLNIAHYNQPC